jgi:hypothetical protein
MSFLQRAKDAASSAAEQARVAAEQARAKAQDPATQERLRLGMVQAGEQARSAGSAAKRGLGVMIDKIDPGVLADVVIKATSLQEKTNSALRLKGSPYRIAEVTITATLPPQVGFSIARVGDVEERLTGNEVDSAVLVQEVLAEEAVGAEDAGVAGGEATNGETPVPLENEIRLPEGTAVEDILP